VVANEPRAINIYIVKWLRPSARSARSATTSQGAAQCNDLESARFKVQIGTYNIMFQLASSGAHIAGLDKPNVRVKFCVGTLQHRIATSQFLQIYSVGGEGEHGLLPW